MSIQNPKILQDPTQAARYDGQLEGQRAMRDRIASMIAGEAAQTDSVEVSESLWRLANQIRTVQPL